MGVLFTQSKEQSSVSRLRAEQEDLNSFFRDSFGSFCYTVLLKYSTNYLMKEANIARTIYFVCLAGVGNHSMERAASAP